MSWFILTLTTLFLSADWPRKLFNLLTFSKFGFDRSLKSSIDEFRPRRRSIAEKLILFVALLFLISQVLIPLRQYQYKGVTRWTENGMLFSWHLKTTDKACVASMFAYHQSTDQLFAVPVDKVLTRRQSEVVSYRPQMIAQMADYVADRLHFNGTRSNIYFYSLCQMNFRIRQLLVNPRVNLANETSQQWPYDWVNDLIQLPTFAQEQYPWNWELNANWIRFNDTDNSDFVKAGYKSFRSAQENEPRRQWGEFVNFILATFYGHDKERMKIPTLADL